MKYRLIVENELGRFGSDADEMSDDTVRQLIDYIREGPQNLEMKQNGSVLVFPAELLRRSIFTVMPVHDER